jgi:predicted dehydrogenase
VTTEHGEKIRVGLIGTGFGQEHLRQLRSLPEVSVDWLAYGHNRERAEELAREANIKHVTADWREVVAAPLTAVVIVAPVGLHHPIAKAALAAGRIVVCDKPLAVNLAHAQELAQLAEQSAHPSMVFFQWRFHAGPRTLRSWLRAGVFGEVQHIDLQFRHDFLAAQTTAWEWRHRRASAGAGAFGDLGIHLIDLLLWLNGEDHEVVAASTQKMWTKRIVDSGPDRGETIECETEDAGQALLRAGSGGLASIYVSRCAPGYRNIRIVITGTKSSAILEIEPESGTHDIQWRGSAGVNLPAEEVSLSPYSVWLDAVHNNSRSGIPTFADGARAQKIMEDILTRAG